MESAPVVRELITKASAARSSRASDNGTELTSNAILSWTAETGVDWHYMIRESPCRTLSSRASMGGYGTSS